MAVLGREVERTRIDRLLADARLSASGALALVGEPGIGKTALLDHAADEARSAGMEVLRARGTEFEAGIPFGGCSNCCGRSSTASTRCRPDRRRRCGPRWTSAATRNRTAI